MECDRMTLCNVLTRYYGRESGILIVVPLKASILYHDDTLVIPLSMDSVNK